MNLKYLRHKRLEKRELTRQGEEQKACEDVLRRAAERYSHAVKSGAVSPLELQPDAQVRVLQKYVLDLEDVIEELESDFGPYAEREVGLIRVDIRRAVHMVARLKVGKVKPALL